MNRNSITWRHLVLVVLVTMTISFAPLSSHCQQDNSTKHDTKGSWNIEKYPVAEYEVPEPSNAADREVRRQKSKRYDEKSFVMPKPRPEFTMSVMYDAEPEPSALPVNESKAVIIGEILSAKGSMSTNRNAVYSEYSVRIERVLRYELAVQMQNGQIVSTDRTGGRVRYQNGQTILYLNSWQDLPTAAGRYLFFLDKEDGSSPNFKILTAYRLKDGKVFALDGPKKFHEFDGKEEVDFIKLVMSSN